MAREYHRQQLKVFTDDVFRFNYQNELSKPPQNLCYQPIFILSAGWRSGSTLLQRLIGSSEDIFIWGEPLDKSNVVTQLADSLRPVCKEWPPENYFYTKKHIDDLSNSWVANLSPHIPEFIEAHRAFFIKLFAEPVLSQKITRWGIKEVRFGLSEALYLKILFP